MDRWAILGSFFFLQKTLIIRMGWPVTKRKVCYDKNIFPGAVSFCNELFLTIRLNLFFKPALCPTRKMAPHAMVSRHQQVGCVKVRVDSGGVLRGASGLPLVSHSPGWRGKPPPPTLIYNRLSQPTVLHSTPPWRWTVERSTGTFVTQSPHDDALT